MSQEAQTEALYQHGGVGIGMEVQKGEDIYIAMADSC